MDRTELSAASHGEGTPVVAVCHVSDLHVMDSVSPMRFEWIETLAADPRWRPLLHMHRPHEALVPWAVAAHVAAIRAAGDADLVLSTGDNIDNAQRNELDAYVSLVAGGEVSLRPVGGVHDAEPCDVPYPYWSPSADVVDVWKPLGYPTLHDWHARTGEPVRSAGVGVPWTSLPGNHDLMCQGTADVSRALAAAAVGDRKAIWPRAGFAPDHADSLFVEWPELFLGDGDRRIEADPNRRAIGRAEWVDAHRAAGALGWGEAVVTERSADAVVDLDDVRLVLLDTNHPHADYHGSVGAHQIEWLHAQLSAADADGRLAILATHHGPSTLVNERGADPTRLLGDPVLAAVQQHPSVVLWLNGHRHINRVVPRPGRHGGLWEITTCSLIDWPCERRNLVISRHAGGGVSIRSTMLGNGQVGIDSPAGWHLDVAHRFAGDSGAHGRSAMEGAEADRDVVLWLER